MYQISKTFRFEDSHQLPNHDGKCRRLHGHSWVGKVTIQGSILQIEGPKAGMLMDYGDIKKIVDPIVEEYLDHHHLNESLEMMNPTSEHIAEWLFYKLLPNLPNLHSVCIEETCTSAAMYMLNEDAISNR